jgi:hypothetical protein
MTVLDAGRESRVRVYHRVAAGRPIRVVWVLSEADRLPRA